MPLPVAWDRRRNVVYGIDAPLAGTPMIPHLYQCLTLTTAHVEKYFSSDALRARHDRYLRLLEVGCRGYLIADGPSWAAVGWIAPVGVAWPAHLPRAIATTENWLFDDHTAELHRRQGLQQYLIARRVTDCLASGITGQHLAVADVNPHNYASRRSFIKNGFAEVGIITSYRVRFMNKKLPPIGRLTRGATVPGIPRDWRHDHA